MGRGTTRLSRGEGMIKKDSMKIIIHYNGAYEDSIVIEGETIEEIKKMADIEVKRRGWERKNCWSEEVK